MKKKIVLLTLICFSFLLANSQDLSKGNKTWYSSYVYYKINKKMYLDSYFLFGFNGFNQSFSFNQNDFALNYRVKKHTFYIGVSQANYKWRLFYRKKYPQKISSVGTINFKQISLGYIFNYKITKLLRLKNEIKTQYYFPRLEKYQTRISNKTKVYLRNKKWPLQAKPFVQFTLYYYLNGMPVLYYKNGTEISKYKSPDGFHRYRLKLGCSIKPIKSLKNVSFIAYYAYQREFNLPFLSNDLNTIRPGNVTEISSPFTPLLSAKQNPFNNYSIFGLQINLIF